MWVVDTCVILDVLLNDPEFGYSSAMFLEDKLPDGLCVCPLTVIELSPSFRGEISEVNTFLRLTGINFNIQWEFADTEVASKAFTNYLILKKQGQVKKRPIADILIGAFAVKQQGLITRNVNDFKKYFDNLEILHP